MLVRASSGSGGGGTVNLEPFCKAWTGGLGITITGISFTPSKFEFKTSDNYKGFNVRELLKYTKDETERSSVDPPYRYSYKKYHGCF